MQTNICTMLPITVKCFIYAVWITTSCDSNSMDGLELESGTFFKMPSTWRRLVIASEQSSIFTPKSYLSGWDASFQGYSPADDLNLPNTLSLQIQNHDAISSANTLSLSPSLAPTFSLPKPSAMPTQEIFSWVNTVNFDGIGCTGSVIDASGESLNVCIPIYSSSINHPSQSYMLIGCGPSEQITRIDYTHFGNCTGPRTSTHFSSSCQVEVNSDSGVVKYVKTGVCTSDLSIPRNIAGVVIQTDYDTCGGNALTYHAMSTLKCQISQQNDYTSLYLASTAYLCAGEERQPQVLGYLGTHCSYPSMTVNLSRTCERSPRWDRSSAPYRQYDCVPKQPRAPQPSGYCYLQTYTSVDCTGPVLMTTGSAQGACYVGYSNSTVAVGSVQYSSEGVFVYSSLNCTGAARTSQIYLAESFECYTLKTQRQRTAVSTYGVSAKMVCSGSNVIPKPSDNSIVQSFFTNDLCFDTPVAFAAYALDVNISTGRGSAVYTCSSGMPELSQIRSGGSLSASRTFLNTRCSYENPAYTPEAVVLYSSTVFSLCPSEVLVSTTQHHSKQCGLRRGDVAALVIAFIIVSSLGTAAGMYFFIIKGINRTPRDNSLLLNEGPTHTTGPFVQMTDTNFGKI